MVSFRLKGYGVPERCLGAAVWLPRKQHHGGLGGHSSDPINPMSGSDPLTQTAFPGSPHISTFSERWHVAMEAAA